MPKNVVCKKCNNLVNDWCEKVIDSPDQDMQRDCQYFCEKTNADRFRVMSNEEQQNFVRKFWEIEDFADWLQQPAEEDDYGKQKSKYCNS